MAIFLAFVVTAPAWAQKATQFEIEESLTCQCGCGLTVHACNHLNCGSGEPIKKEIAERLARGEDKPTILAAFQQRFGEKILSSPSGSGFNLLAWTVPGVSVLLAAGLLLVVIRRRVGETAPALENAPKPSAHSEAERSKLKNALDQFDEDA